MEEATVCTVAVWFALILYTGTITLGGKKTVHVCFGSRDDRRSLECVRLCARSLAHFVWPLARAQR